MREKERKRGGKENKKKKERARQEKGTRGLFVLIFPIWGREDAGRNV